MIPEKNFSNNSNNSKIMLVQSIHGISYCIENVRTFFVTLARRVSETKAENE